MTEQAQQGPSMFELLSDDSDPIEEMTEHEKQAQQATDQRDHEWWLHMLPVAMAQLELARQLMETCVDMRVVLILAGIGKTPYVELDYLDAYHAPAVSYVISPGYYAWQQIYSVVLARTGRTNPDWWIDLIRTEDVVQAQLDLKEEALMEETISLPDQVIPDWFWEVATQAVTPNPRTRKKQEYPANE